MCIRDSDQSLITSKSIYDIFKYVNENYMNITLKELAKWHHLSAVSYTHLAIIGVSAPILLLFIKS